MKALSVRQPWAWFIINGFKDIENRTWPTSFRGPVLIHASKTPASMSYEDIIRYYDVDINDPEVDHRRGFALQLKFGGIVGYAEIVDSVSFSDSKWFQGPYGFVLRNSRPLPFQACRGQLGFFDVDYNG